MDLPLLIEAAKAGGPALVFAVVGIWFARQMVEQLTTAITRLEERLDRMQKEMHNDSLLHLANILGKQMNQTEIAAKIVDLVQNRINAGQ